MNGRQTANGDRLEQRKVVLIPLCQFQWMISEWVISVQVSKRLPQDYTDQVPFLHIPTNSKKCWKLGKSICKGEGITERSKHPEAKSLKGSNILCSENENQRTVVVHRSTRSSSCCQWAAIPEARKTGGTPCPGAQDVPSRRLFPSMSSSSLTNPSVQASRVAWSAGTASRHTHSANQPLQVLGINPASAVHAESISVTPPKYPGKKTV